MCPEASHRIKTIATVVAFVDVVVFVSSIAIAKDAGFSLTFHVVGTPEFLGPPKITESGFTAPITETIYLPEQAKCLVEKGAGSYEALIGPDGSVASVHSLYEPIDGDKCERASLFPYVKKWRFKPATYNGNPTPVFMRFQLK